MAVVEGPVLSGLLDKARGRRRLTGRVKAREGGWEGAVKNEADGVGSGLAAEIVGSEGKGRSGWSGVKR